MSLRLALETNAVKELRNQIARLAQAPAWYLLSSVTCAHLEWLGRRGVYLIEHSGYVHVACDRVLGICEPFGQTRVLFPRSLRLLLARWPLAKEGVRGDVAKKANRMIQSTAKSHNRVNQKHIRTGKIRFG